MKNIDKYIDELKKDRIDVCGFTQKHVLNHNNCGALTCKQCHAKLFAWLYEEYKPQIDWSKVPVDTPVFFIKDGLEYKGHFAGYGGFDLVNVYDRGTTSWSGNSIVCTTVNYLRLARPEDIEKYSI
jgi:hypothetical protein